MSSLPWTGDGLFAPYSVFSIVLELPTRELGASPSLGISGRASVRSNGKLDHLDRAGHPLIASFYNTDETCFTTPPSRPSTRTGGCPLTTSWRPGWR